jgi:serine/threonine-protein kinase
VNKVAPGGRFADARTRIRIAREQAAAEGEKLYLMVMDYIEGTDVRTFGNDHLKRDLLLPVPLGAFIASRAARALAYAHQFIIHRDVSPENLLLNMQGVLKLSDFGVAVSEAAEGLTGKLSYMSPEQLAGEAVDARTDLYSLGLVLYFLLTGVPLQKVPARLAPPERVEFVRRLGERPILPPARVRRDVPEALSEICMKMLARDRRQRYATAEEVTRDLEQRYLYARGFGPTNNSMQAYLEIFDANFKETTPEQLQQLPFLHGEVRRAVSPAHYTPEGRALLEEALHR